MLSRSVDIESQYSWHLPNFDAGHSGVHVTVVKGARLDLLSRKVGEKAVESAPVRVVPYITLAGAAAAGEPGVAIVIQAVRQIVARVGRRNWPIAAVYHPTKWFYECEGDCLLRK